MYSGICKFIEKDLLAAFTLSSSEEESRSESDDSPDEEEA